MRLECCKVNGSGSSSSICSKTTSANSKKRFHMKNGSTLKFSSICYIEFGTVGDHRPSRRYTVQRDLVSTTRPNSLPISRSRYPQKTARPDQAEHPWIDSTESANVQLAHSETQRNTTGTSQVTKFSSLHALQFSPCRDPAHVDTPKDRRPPASFTHQFCRRGLYIRAHMQHSQSRNLHCTQLEISYLECSS